MYGSDYLLKKLIPSPLAVYLPISYDSTILKLGQSKILQWLLSVQMKRRVKCLSNERLEMIKFNEESMSELNIGWKLELLCQKVSQVVKVK